MSPAHETSVKRSGAFISALDVLAVVAMDRDPAAERDVSDDLVAGHRATALGEADDDVVDALDLDPVARRFLGAALALVAALEDTREP